MTYYALLQTLDFGVVDTLLFLYRKMHCHGSFNTHR